MNKQAFLRWLGESPGPLISPPGYRRKPWVMGILNVTPDSFSDGGRYLHVDEAMRRADEMIAQGVDLIDLGGASSKPGAQSVSPEEELDRVLPVIHRMREHTDVCLSIDTTHPLVMRVAVEAGVTLINDIKALHMPGALLEVARLDVPVCLMHMQGEPATMQEQPMYPGGVVPFVQQFFRERLLSCDAANIQREHILLDPGFGFGKSVAHNLSMMKRLMDFQVHGRPVVLGFSRKNTLGVILKQAIEHRTAGGLGLAVFAALQGVSMIRTHDVFETKQALDMLDAVVCVKDEGEGRV